LKLIFIFPCLLSPLLMILFSTVYSCFFYWRSSSADELFLSKFSVYINESNLTGEKWTTECQWP